MGKPLPPLASREPHSLTRLSSDCSTTSMDGRMDKSKLASLQLESGTYKLRFATGEYWQQQGLTSFYPYVEVSFHFSCTRASNRSQQTGLPVALGPPIDPKRKGPQAAVLWAFGLLQSRRSPCQAKRPPTLHPHLFQVVFTITEAERKVHIPLLFSPYSYVTYRGS